MVQTTDFPNAQTIPILIPANGQVVFPIVGNTVRCLESTAAFKAILDGSGSGIELSAGLSFSCSGDTQFSTVTLKNETGSVITAKVFIGFGTMDDSRLTLTGSVMTVKPENSKGFLVNEVGIFSFNTRIDVGTSTVNIAGWSSNSIKRVLKNIGTSVAYLSSNSPVVLATDYPLDVGEKIEWCSSNSIYAKCDVGFSTQIQILNFTG